MRPIIFCLLSWLPLLTWSQIERIYDREGHLRTVIPINGQGEYEGMGYTYYASGALARETPYVEGVIEGTVREFYQDGSLKATIPYQQGQKHGQALVYFRDERIKALRPWQYDHLQGHMYMYYPSGRLYLYSYVQQDSILFAQRFDTLGRLTRELMGNWRHPLDTRQLGEIRVFVQQGEALSPNRPNDVQVMLPGIPLALIRFSIEGGRLVNRDDQALPFFLSLHPDPGSTEVVVHLRASLRPGAASSLLKSVTIPVR